MSATLMLAEAYYTVAADLERNAQEQLRIASMLNRFADSLCESNVAEETKKARAAEPQEVARDE